MAQSLMVHSPLHWTDRGLDDIPLWLFAVKHAGWLYNCVPNRLSSLTLLEFLPKSNADHHDLLRMHVLGCPAIVLESNLQNDQMLPKWNRRAWVGLFLGYLDEQPSLVANMHHLSTGYICPQFHVNFDDLFETVICNGDNNVVIDSFCDGLFTRNHELYVEVKFDADGLLVYKSPSLHEVWLDEEGQRHILFFNFFVVQLAAPNKEITPPPYTPPQPRIPSIIPSIAAGNYRLIIGLNSKMAATKGQGVVSLSIFLMGGILVPKTRERRASRAHPTHLTINGPIVILAQRFVGIAEVPLEIEGNKPLDGRAVVAHLVVCCVLSAVSIL